ncbi:MAG: fumarylacetoacetate hydrolase family protein [Planctomycetota bacterium]|jgi:2-keto-4-pentenoate hydratase/2-oxohepta-3-ene-1,7-dioic acid hydratase in catechol pathway
MKLVTYNRDDLVSCAVLTDNGLLDIPAIWPGPNPPRTIIDILQLGPECLEAISSLAIEADTYISLETVKLLAPVPRPGKAIALAGNYSEHIAEASHKRGFKLGLSDSTRKTTVPRPFIIPSTAIIDPDDEIQWPAYSEQIDYEIELAVVIGKKTKCISSAEALDHVAGYTICNDISARSVTFKEARKERPWDEFYDWLNGKWADGFLPMGPFLLTADEVEDVQNLNLTLKVNDEIRQRANTNQMIYPVTDIVSFLSYIMTLEPGDVIATGTPAGVAVATGNFLKGGDNIECTIEKLGTLTNSLSQPPAEFYKPLR